MQRKGNPGLSTSDGSSSTTAFKHSCRWCTFRFQQLPMPRRTVQAPQVVVPLLPVPPAGERSRPTMENLWLWCVQMDSFFAHASHAKCLRELE